jgi:hypothetical protein
MTRATGPAEPGLPSTVSTVTAAPSSPGPTGPHRSAGDRTLPVRIQRPPHRSGRK